MTHDLLLSSSDPILFYRLRRGNASIGSEFDIREGGNLGFTRRSRGTGPWRGRKYRPDSVFSSRTDRFRRVVDRKRNDEGLAVFSLDRFGLGVDAGAELDPLLLGERMTGQRLPLVVEVFWVAADVATIAHLF